MKKNIVSITVATVVAATLIGCATKTPKPDKILQFGCKQEGVVAPKWTCVPMVEGAYAGVGIAKKSAAGMSFMRKVAQMNGRSDLAQQIRVQVKSRMKGFTQTTGSQNSETVDQMTQAVDDQIANVDLSRSKTADYWQAPSRNIYILMTVPEDYINKKVKDIAKTSFKNDNALWQQFQASQAFEAMDKAIDK